MHISFGLLVVAMLIPLFYYLIGLLFILLFTENKDVNQRIKIASFERVVIGRNTIQLNFLQLEDGSYQWRVKARPWL